jgi:predicted phosphodiesterase
MSHDLLGEMVNVVKDLTLELGHVPTRREFQTHIKGGDYKLNKIGGYVTLLHAAGMGSPTERNKERKIDSSIFVRDVERHIAEYTPAEYKPRGPYPSAAIISDIHWPFHCQRVIDAFWVYIEEYQPEWVIVNGDAWDMFSHSKFPRSHNIFTPRDEEKMAREQNEKFWAEVRRRSPNSKCVQMMGNHDIRPLKRILESYPSAEDWVARELERLFTYEGVKTIHDPREELHLAEDIIVFHGYRSKLGDHRNYTLLSCINGHTHVGGVVWRQIRGGVLFEMNSGVAGDPMSKGLTYTPQKITHWTPGFGAIDAFGPRFIPC